MLSTSRLNPFEKAFISKCNYNSFFYYRLLECKSYSEAILTMSCMSLYTNDVIVAQYALSLNNQCLIRFKTLVFHSLLEYGVMFSSAI